MWVLSEGSYSCVLFRGLGADLGHGIGLAVVPGGT